MKKSKKSTLPKRISKKDEIKIRSSPAGHCITTYNWTDLYQWQIDSMNSIAPMHSSTSLSAANGTGKTSKVVVGTGLWHMVMFPGSKVIYTSASNRQIHGQLEPALKEVVNKYHPTWKITSSLNQLTIEDPATGSSWDCYATTDEGLIEGWHPPSLDRWITVQKRKYKVIPQLFVMMDEMKTLKQKIIDNLILRCKHTRLLCISSTPLIPDGGFYDNHHSNKEDFNHGLIFETQAIKGYNLFEVNFFDCPHLCDDKAMLTKTLKFIESRGRNHHVIKSTIYNEWPEQGERMVFNLARVDDCMNIVTSQYGTDKRITIDLSGGRDEIVLMVRIGNRSWIEWTSHEEVGPVLVRELAKYIKGLKSRYGFRNEEIFGDEGAMGKIILQYLEREGLSGLSFFNFGDPANNPVLYKNARAEMYFELSDRINLLQVILPKDPLLKKQLGMITYEPGEDKQVKLTPKARMSSSPDRADTCAMSYYNMPKLEEVQSQQKQIEIALSPTRHADGINSVWINTNEPVYSDGGLYF